MRGRNWFFCAKRSCDFMQVSFFLGGKKKAKGSITQCENNRAQYLAGYTVRSAKISWTLSSHFHRRDGYGLPCLLFCLAAPQRDQRLSCCKTYANKAFFITLLTSYNCLAKTILFNCLISHLITAYSISCTVGRQLTELSSLSIRLSDG